MITVVAWGSLVVGRARRPVRQMVRTGVGAAVVTASLLVGARALGEAWVGVGGFLLLAVMTVTLIVGAYHAYRNAGLLTSCLPLFGVVVGVAGARLTIRGLGWTTVQRGLGTVDLAVVLLAVAVVAAVGAHAIGVLWRR